MPHSKRINSLIAKRDALMTKIAKAHAQEAREARKLQTRQKVLIGAAVLSAILKNRFTQDQLMKLLRENLSERDYQVFRI